MNGGLVGLVLGLVIGMGVGIAIDLGRKNEANARYRAEQEKAKQKAEADNKVEATLRAEVLRVASERYPGHLATETLLDGLELKSWPDRLFHELFKVPEIVIPYAKPGGGTGEVHLWSLETVNENAKDERYQDYVRRVEREYEEEQRWERERAEEERKAAEAIEALKAKQQIVPFEQLKQRR